MARPTNPTLVKIHDVLVEYGDKAMKPYRKLSKRGKTIVWIIGGLHVVAVILIFFVIGTKRISEWFNAMALGLREMGFKGVLLVGLAVAAASHPPLLGFSPSMTLIGFAYGLRNGVLIGSAASLIGGAIAFISIRTFFLEWVRKFGASQSKSWEAFGHVMRDKGLPLVIMIRWCPLPWAVGNGLFASIDGVQFWHFMLANLTFLPRLCIPVFIGSRLNSLTDGDDKPDPLRFWINLGSIVISLSFSIITGTLIYRLTLNQMRKMDYGHPHDLEDGELAAAALERSALLGDFSETEDVEEELIPILPRNTRN